MKFKNQAEAVEFYEYLDQEKKLGPRTVEVYMIYYSCFDPELCNEEYITKYARKHKNTSACRGFIKNYLEFKKLNIPMPSKPKGRKPIRLPRDISQSELQALREHFYAKSFKKGLIFDLMYQGALRRVEITSIKLNSFKWDKWIEQTDKFCRLIVLGKGNKEREVLINPETAESIAMYFLKKHDIITFDDLKDILNKEILLFTNVEGNPLTEHDIYYFIKKGSREVLKNRYIRPHEIRHARATELENKGISARDIQKYLGHARISTTELYLHRSNEKMIDSVESYLRT